jgi:hypothetical protein
MKEIKILQDITKGFRIGIGIILALTTAGIFAVAVTGTFNTFSSGSVMKSADINANFASLKAAIEGIPTEKAMRLIHETEVPTATTSFDITGLNGDSDIEYEIRGRFITPNTSNVGFYSLLNLDATTSNYSVGALIGNSGNANPYRQLNATDTGLWLCGAVSTSNTSFCNFRTIIYAKSGFTRSSITTSFLYKNSGSSWELGLYGGNYSVTGTNITSMRILSNQTNGIGAGSHIEVWAKR